MSRKYNMKNPAGLAEALASQSVNWAQDTKELMTNASPVLQKVITFALSMVGASNPLGIELKDVVPLLFSKAKAKVKPSPSLTEVLQAYEDFMSKQGKSRVVLVIDECNTLTQWSAEDQPDIDALLSFFIMVSKQDRRAKVILATSESAFVDWLRKREAL